MQTKTIAVTGATGFVGRYVVRELLKRGYAVRALVRDAAKARAVFGSPLPQGLASVYGDVCDPRALGELVRGCDAVIHLVGIIGEERGDAPDHPQTFERMHVTATRAVLEACRAAGVRRYLHMSALGVGPEGRTRYQQTKWEAEGLVRRSGLDWTVFRPSIIHGPDGMFVQLQAELCSGETAPWFFIPYFAGRRVDHAAPGGIVTYVPAKVQPVAAEDVAYAFAQALETPASIGEVYNLVGSETLDFREMAEFFRDTIPGTKKNMSTWYVPGEHAAVLARVACKVGLGPLLPFNEGQAIMATEDNTADPTKARIDLGLQPRPFRQTVREYAHLV